MQNNDKPNGKMTRIELEMLLDDIIAEMPTQIKINHEFAKMLKAKYDSLVEAGFSKEEALEVIKARGLNQ